MITRRFTTLCAAAAAFVVAAVPRGLVAQQRPPRPAPAPIQGEAPTPQLITVRPREPLRFDAQLVVPTFYDRSFWPSILAGYDVALPGAAVQMGAPSPVKGAPAVVPPGSRSPAPPVEPRRRRRPPPR